MGHPGQGICERLRGEIAKIGILWSRRSTRPVQGERSSGSAGIAALVKWRVRRRKPHRKALGRVSNTLSRDRRTRSSSCENGLSIADNFSRSEFVTVKLIEITRSDCFSAAMILFSSSVDGGQGARSSPYCTTTGRVGQQSRVFSTGVTVPCVKNSRRCSAR
jgi:hypothetical protein